MFSPFPRGRFSRRYDSDDLDRFVFSTFLTQRVRRHQQDLVDSPKPLPSLLAILDSFRH